MFIERARQEGKKLVKWVRANPWRQVALATAGVAALAVVIADKESIIDRVYGNPGYCSEIGRMVPLQAAIPETHTYTAENTNGGVLNAPIRAMRATRYGILFGHASPGGAPDPDGPENPVRYLTGAGIEICQARTPLRGSVNTIFEHPQTNEIIVGYDSGDPNKREGYAVSIFEYEKDQWTHHKNIPNVLDQRVYGAAANGLETWFATYQGISRHYPNEGWRVSLNFPKNAFHSVMVTRQRDLVVVGQLENGLQTDPKTPEINNHPVQIKKVRDIQEGPDGKIWVAADGGLASYDRQQKRWSVISLPMGAKEVMAIRFSPIFNLPSIATLDKGTFSWDGMGFTRIDENPALSLAFGQPGSSLENKIFIGTRFRGLVERPVLK